MQVTPGSISVSGLCDLPESESGRRTLMKKRSKAGFVSAKCAESGRMRSTCIPSPTYKVTIFFLAYCKLSLDLVVVLVAVQVPGAIQVQ